MKDSKSESTITRSVYANVDQFVRRAGAIGYIGENKDKVSQHTSGTAMRSKLNYWQSPQAAPVVHAIVNLISQATSPIHLAQMGELFMPWY